MGIGRGAVTTIGKTVVIVRGAALEQAGARHEADIPGADHGDALPLRFRF